MSFKLQLNIMNGSINVLTEIDSVQIFFTKWKKWTYIYTCHKCLLKFNNDINECTNSYDYIKLLLQIFTTNVYTVYNLNSKIINTMVTFFTQWLPRKRQPFYFDIHPYCFTEITMTVEEESACIAFRNLKRI